MATRCKSRARRSRRYLTIVKPSGSLHPRVQKVGPEHFGIGYTTREPRAGSLQGLLPGGRVRR
jgi:hypothetical protein